MVVPATRPETSPVLLPIVAFEVLLLLQVPPNDAFDSVMVAPTQTVDGPVILGGNGFTVTTAELTHPVGIW